MKINTERLMLVVKALRESPNAKAWDTGRCFDSVGWPTDPFGHYVAREDLQTFLKRSNGASRYVENGNIAFAFSPSVCDHFGITDRQAEELFGPLCCDEAESPTEAIAYFERFIREHT